MKQGKPGFVIIDEASEFTVADARRITERLRELDGTTSIHVELYQAVEIHLTDGRKAAFMGPVLVTEEDERAGVRIRQIRFIEAKPLPPGYSFTDLPGATSPITRPESSGGTNARPSEEEPPNARPRARKPRKAQ